MTKYMTCQMNLILNQVKHMITNVFGETFPPALCVINTNHYDYMPEIAPNSHGSESLQDIITNGFLWAVPKTRRPLEKRLSRKFGAGNYIWRMIKIQKHLVVCSSCGHDHERGVLCHNCYTRVKTETNEIQTSIIENLGLEPVEKEVIILYHNENAAQSKDYWKGQRVIELPKKRPAWFHSNLLQPTTQEPAISKDVQPTNLA